MVEFEIINSKFITFIERCACKGTVLITATSKTTRNFFSHFYMDVTKDGIIVKAIDSEEKKMYIRHYLSNVDVKETGIFAVSNSQALLEVLKAIPGNREISFKETDEAILIETIDEGHFYGFKLRKFVQSDFTKVALEKSKYGVSSWDSIHTFEDGFPKVEYKGEVGFYDTVIYFNRGELVNVVQASTSLTKDQDIVMFLRPDSVSFKSGKKSDNVIAETTYKKEIVNPITKNALITNLHPIVGHLFSKVIFFCRVASDGALKFWIQSADDDIELNFCSASA